MKNPWSKREEKFLVDNYGKIDTNDLLNLINEKFGNDRSKQSLTVRICEIRKRNNVKPEVQKSKVKSDIIKAPISQLPPPEENWNYTDPWEDVAKLYTRLTECVSRYRKQLLEKDSRIAALTSALNKAEQEIIEVYKSTQDFEEFKKSNKEIARIVPKNIVSKLNKLGVLT